MRTAKALARLRGFAVSPEPPLVAYMISTIISLAGSFLNVPLYLIYGPSLVLDALSLVGPNGVQLLDFCCPSVSGFTLLSKAHLVSSER